MTFDPKTYGNCTACGEFVVQGRGPFQSVDLFYANRMCGAFCEAAEGQPHTLVEKPKPKYGPRTYTTGVPLAITVHDDGRVELDVDLSEVHDMEHVEIDTFPLLEADTTTVSLAAGRLGNCLTMTINPTIAGRHS